ncbi:amino acid adenylation domain-containing protein [Streptomyces sp. BK205]|nr:amino acid adenylation domain-containing protein [Streptomyces sp. BK205]
MPDVDPEEGFRELGGDSLRAVRAAGRLAIALETTPAAEEAVLEALLDGASCRLLAELLQDEHVVGPTDTEDGTAGQSREGVDEHGPAPGGAEPGTLAPGEELLWLGWRHHPENPAYHVVNAFRVTGSLDVPALDRAVRSLVARHPALRTSYDEDTPVAAVRPAHDHVPDTGHSEAEGWQDALRLARDAALRPLDLVNGRPFRIRTYSCGPDEWLLLIVVHHLVVDGWSMRLLFRDLAAAYAGTPLGKGGDYREFARHRRARSDTAAQEWAERLLPLPDRVELAAGHRRPPTRSLRGDVLCTTLPELVVTGLRKVAVAEDSSLFVVLLSLLHLCVARRTRRWDGLLGTVVAGRPRAEDHETVGFFANTVPVRVTVDPADAFAAVVRGLREEWRHVVRHQEVALSDLVVHTRSVPDPARAPLVDVVLVLQEMGDGVLELPGCTTRRERISTGTAKFDLMVEAAPQPDGSLELAWEYGDDALDVGTARDTAEFFGHLAAMVADNPHIEVRAAIRPSPAERTRLAELNTPAPDEGATDIVTVFDRVVASSGAQPAVYDGEDHLTFAGLGRLRDQVAAALLASGVRPGDVVALRLPRSPLVVAAMLATWTVGGVLVMLDTRHPADHQERLLRACQPAVVLAADADDSLWPVITPDRIMDTPTGAMPTVPRAPEDPAWLVCTSGSTGTPKITTGTHRGLRNRCAWERTVWPFAEDDVVALRTPLGFVDAIAETLVPLLAGTPVVVVPEPVTWDVPALARLVARCRVTRLLVTPSLMRTMLDTLRDPFLLASLRMCKFSGEELDATLLDRTRRALPPGCRLVNLYGSAECAGDATAADVTRWPSDEAVPLGRPLTATEVRVVGQDGEPVPPGVVGELVVVGAPVGLGYLDPEILSAVRTGGFHVGDGDAVYRTGDRGWLAPDGSLRFAGRMDRQVKIRGCRVELGQVEAALRAVDGIQDAVAWAQQRPAGPRLMAVVAPAPSASIRGDQAREALRARWPGYMVPAQVIVTDVLAMTANGKLDRAAAMAAAERHAPEEVPVLESELERRIQAVWARFLDGEAVGARQGFFAMGGDSLAANQMLAEVMRQTGVVVDLGQFLKDPTIAGLARLVHADEAGAGTRVGR